MDSWFWLHLPYVSYGKMWFVEFVDLIDGQVHIGNDISCQIKEIGRLSLLPRSNHILELVEDILTCREI